MAKKRNEHVVLKRDGSNKMACMHCGDEYALPMPMELWAFGALIKAFGEEHADCDPEPAVVARFAEEARRRVETSQTMTPDQWRASDDTGISSLTIWSVMTGRRVASRAYPRDPDDFGRCHRLLERIPAWRERLPEVAAACPDWAGLVREWPRMTEIYLRDLPTGESAEIYEIMQQLSSRGGA